MMPEESEEAGRRPKLKITFSEIVSPAAANGLGHGLISAKSECFGFISDRNSSSRCSQSQLDRLGLVLKWSSRGTVY